MSCSIKIDYRFVSEKLARVENLVLRLTSLAFFDLQPRLKQPPGTIKIMSAHAASRLFRCARLIYRQGIIVKRHRSHTLDNVVDQDPHHSVSSNETEIAQSCSHQLRFFTDSLYAPPASVRFETLARADSPGSVSKASRPQLITSSPQLDPAAAGCCYNPTDVSQGDAGPACAGAPQIQSLATERHSKDNLPLSEDLLSSTPRSESFVLL